MGGHSANGPEEGGATAVLRRAEDIIRLDRGIEGELRRAMPCDGLHASAELYTSWIGMQL